MTVRVSRLEDVDTFPKIAKHVTEIQSMPQVPPGLNLFAPLGMHLSAQPSHSCVSESRSLTKSDSACQVHLKDRNWGLKRLARVGGFIFMADGDHSLEHFGRTLHIEVESGTSI